MRSLVGLLLLLLASPAWAEYTAIPRLSTWESNMTTAGAARCHDADEVLVNISSSTDATPIVIQTASNHGFTVPMGAQPVHVAGHLVNTNANGYFLATAIDSTHLSLGGTTATGGGAGGATGTATTAVNIGQCCNNGAAYYDGNKVFHNIWAYTGDSSWLVCADSMKQANLNWIRPYNYGISAFHVFTEGLLATYQRAGGSSYVTDITNLCTTATFMPDGSANLYNPTSLNIVREFSYSIMCYLDAEKVGVAHRGEMDLKVTDLVGSGEMFDQMLCYCPLDVITGPPNYHQPWQTGGVAMHALTRVMHTYPDSRLVPKMKAVLDKMWTHDWTPNCVSAGEGAFLELVYFDGHLYNDPSCTSVGLNMFIAPAFAWMYLYTGDTAYRDRGNLLFSSAAQYAYLGVGKQFNQNYLWSPNYKVWYDAAELCHNEGKCHNHPAATNTPAATNRPAATSRPANFVNKTW